MQCRDWKTLWKSGVLELVLNQNIGLFGTFTKRDMRSSLLIINKISKLFIVVTSIITHTALTQSITETFGSGANQFSIDFVTIGNPNNPNDYDVRNSGYGPSHGSVPYTYNMGKYEVTVSQYTAFLNSAAKADPFGLFNPNMYGVTRNGNSGDYIYQVSSGLGNRPIAYTSWFDAGRFVNWLDNGGLSTSSTEIGVYELNGMTTGVPWTSTPNSNRNAAAKFFIPTYEEIYKSGWYDPNKDGVGGYWDGPTGRAEYPGRPAEEAMINVWSQHPDSNGNLTTDVGAFPFSSAYGAYDQGGNVWEITEYVNGGNDIWVKGGSAGDTELAASKYYQGHNPSQEESGALGFRVAMVPEPTALSLLAIGLGGLAMMRRRRS